MRRSGWMILAALALLLLPFFLRNYQVYLGTLVAVQALAALGLNVLTGYAGQVSLGHAGFMAVGGFTAAVLQMQLGLPMLVSLPLAGLFTGLVGLLLVIPALRLSEIYLAIATLGFGVAVQQLLPQLPWTGGHQGLNVGMSALDGWLMWEADFGFFRFNEQVNFYLFAVAVSALLWWLARNAVRSALGRAFIAVRDRELAAESLGISLARTKSYAFLLSAFLTGVAGGLYANAVGYLDVTTFGLGYSIQFLAMIAIGGLASLPGSLLGAAFITLLPNALSGFSQWVPGFIYGASLLGAVMFMPYGLWGAWLRLRGRSRGAMGSIRRALGLEGKPHA